MKTCLSIVCLICAVCAAYVGAQDDVAYTVKTEKLVEQKWWDAKKTKPKLRREYYKVESFNSDDELLDTEEVRHGVYIEWNKKGEHKRILHALKDMPDWYFKLIEHYEDGELTRRDTFYNSGYPKSEEEYWQEGYGQEDNWKGKIIRKQEFYEAADDHGRGLVKSELHYDVRGDVERRSEWGRDGKPTRLEESMGSDAIKRETFQYHADGNLKEHRTEKVMYEWNDQKERTETTMTLRLETQTRKGVRSTFVGEDKAKISEGRYVEQDEDGKKTEVKDGEWKHWDEDGKLLRVEKYDDGELKETKEYK